MKVSARWLVPLAAIGCVVAGHAPPGAAQARGSETHRWCRGIDSLGSSSLVLTSDSLGPVSRLVTRDSLARLCPGLGDSVWEGAEGIPARVTLLRLGGRSIGFIEWSAARQSLLRLLVESPLVRTVDSIGVGTRVGELRRKLGRLNAGYDDAGVYVWSQRAPNLSFLLRLRVTQLVASPDDIAQHPELVPDSATVCTVVLIGARP